MSHSIQGLLIRVCENNRNGIKALDEKKFQDILEDVTSPSLLWCHVPTLKRGSGWKCGSIQTPVTNIDMDRWIRPRSGRSLSQLLLSSWSNLTDLVGGFEGKDWGIKGKYWSNIPSEQPSEYRETPPTPPHYHHPHPSSCLSPSEERSVDYKVNKKNSDGSDLSCGSWAAGTILHCLNATCMKFVTRLLRYLTEVKFMYSQKCNASD